MTALHLAAKNGNFCLMRLLISNQADFTQENKIGVNVLHSGAAGDCPKTIVFFLERGFDINAVDANDRSAVHHAVLTGADDSLKYLIAYGADMNRQDKGGRTALHLAASTINEVNRPDMIRCVEVLLRGGADRKIQANGYTAHDLAL